MKFHRPALAAPVLPSRRALPPHLTQLRVPAKPMLWLRPLRWWQRLAKFVSPMTGLCPAD